VDKVTWADYGQDLEVDFRSLAFAHAA
jgi:hypothetical protein